MHTASATRPESPPVRPLSRPRLGMVGGGQLARMTHQAAVDLDVDLVVLDPDPASPAIMAGATHLDGSGSSPRDLGRLASEVDVITFDHERVSEAGLRSLEDAGAPVRPSAGSKRLAQDKLLARETLEAAGVLVPRWAPARDSREAVRFGHAHGWPVMLKARRGTYDGRGVWEADDPAAVQQVFDEVDGPSVRVELLVEERVEIVRELAVLVARRPSGEIVRYPVVETVQHDGICRWVSFPAGCSPEVAHAAGELAERIAALAGATGIVCVELFETVSGLLVNELALRPHNAGHLTLDACETSQFENHIRAVLDWPLGGTQPSVPAAAMVNVLGPQDGSDPAARRSEALRMPGSRVRLYGKRARPGRKLGHVTAVAETPQEALARARHATEVMSDA